MLRVLTFIEINPHRHSLHNLDVISRGVFGRQQAEPLTSRRGDTLDVAVVFPPAISINGYDGVLAHAHFLQLRLLEISRDPDIFKRHDGQQRLAGLHDFPWLDGLLADHASLGRPYRRVLQVQLCLVERRLGLLHSSLSRFRLGAGDGYLLWTNSRAADLRLRHGEHGPGLFHAALRH